MDHNADEQPPPDALVEQLEQLEALLLIMLSQDIELMAPASRKKLIALAHSLASTAVDVAAAQKDHA